MMSEPRLLYFPLLGLAFVLAELLRQLSQPRWAYALCSIVAALAFGRASVRSLDFASEEAFWAYETQQNPSDPQTLQVLYQGFKRTGHTPQALQVAVLAYDVTRERYAATRVPARFLGKILIDLLVLARSTEQTRSTAGFCTNIEAQEPATLALTTMNLPGPPLGDVVVDGPIWLTANAAWACAQVNRRLGNTASALEFAELALERCGTNCEALRKTVSTWR